MDYNEDRQGNLYKQPFAKKEKKGLASTIVESDQDDDAIIYLNTVGKTI